MDSYQLTVPLLTSEIVQKKYNLLDYIDRYNNEINDGCTYINIHKLIGFSATLISLFIYSST